MLPPRLAFEAVFLEPPALAVSRSMAQSHCPHSRLLWGGGHLIYGSESLAMIGLFCPDASVTVLVGRKWSTSAETILDPGSPSRFTAFGLRAVRYRFLTRYRHHV
jgi:hypothetical protein